MARIALTLAVFLGVVCLAPRGKSELQAQIEALEAMSARMVALDARISTRTHCFPGLVETRL